MQRIGALPQELFIRILKASSTPPVQQLRLLPSAFHTAVVHAAFPSIEADRSIYIEAYDLDYAPLAEALWPALSRITSFRRRDRVNKRQEMSSEEAVASCSQLGLLSSIEQLHLSCNGIGVAAVTSLGP